MAGKDAQHVSASGESQAQQASGNPKDADTPEKRAARDDEPQFFDTTIAKLVEREDTDGETQWIEVMSDNLYPGEKLKRADDEQKAEEKATAAREARFEKADKDKK